MTNKGGLCANPSRLLGHNIGILAYLQLYHLRDKKYLHNIGILSLPLKLEHVD